MKYIGKAISIPTILLLGYLRAIAADIRASQAQTSKNFSQSCSITISVTLFISFFLVGTQGAIEYPEMASETIITKNIIPYIAQK